MRYETEKVHIFCSRKINATAKEINKQIRCSRMLALFKCAKIPPPDTVPLEDQELDVLINVPKVSSRPVSTLLILLQGHYVH